MTGISLTLHALNFHLRNGTVRFMDGKFKCLMLREGINGPIPTWAEFSVVSCELSQLIEEFQRCKKKTVFLCKVCGEITKGRKPSKKNARPDGTFMHPSRHKLYANWCPGCSQEAHWLNIPISPLKGAYQS